jgi:hypothetical protein
LAICARSYRIATTPLGVLDLKLISRYSSYTRLTPDAFTGLHLSFMQQTNCQAALMPSHAGVVVGRTKENSIVSSFIHAPIKFLDCKTSPQPHGGFPRVSWQCTVSLLRIKAPRNSGRAVPVCLLRLFLATPSSRTSPSRVRRRIAVSFEITHITFSS